MAGADFAIGLAMAHYLFHWGKAAAFIRLGGAMNTANLQLQGLLMALAAVLEVMQREGLLETEQLDAVLARAEEKACADLASQELSGANRDAVLFPIRALRWAAASGNSLTFSALAGIVGETKPGHG